mmetsp:Transcript_4210/g.10928  ORF Transcript_4210/g.10928 Transcript_4210/m.10928 type:complete len:153 (-) Transcript_4210:530-988(-)
MPREGRGEGRSAPSIMTWWRGLRVCHCFVPASESAPHHPRQLGWGRVIAGRRRTHTHATATYTTRWIHRIIAADRKAGNGRAVLRGGHHWFTGVTDSHFGILHGHPCVDIAFVMKILYLTWFTSRPAISTATGEGRHVRWTTNWCHGALPEW